MMSSSRFDLLPDVNLDEPTGKKKTKSKNKGSTNNKNNSNQKQKQNAANSTAANNQKSKNKNKKTQGNKQEEKQFEEWRERDSGIVDGAFTSELEQAMLFSKIEYEKEVAKNQQKQPSKNKKKTVTCTLEEFNANFNATNDLTQAKPEKTIDYYEEEDDSENLEKKRAEVKEEIKKVQQKDKEKVLVERHNSEYLVATLTNKVEELHEQNLKKERLIEGIQKEKDHLKIELELSKSKFKKLCSVLSDADMKEKVFLVTEIEKLQKVNEDLNKDICQLHGEIERERTKSHSLQNDLKLHNHNRKRTNTDTSQDCNVIEK